MDLDNAIRGRRSVREYTDETVTEEQIEMVLEAGTWAPSAMDRQPLRFIIIENKELIKRISDETVKLVRTAFPQIAPQFSGNNNMITYNAPMLILVCTEKDPQWAHTNILDCVLATQNMFLKAYELGLGTCYMGFISMLNNTPQVLREIGVPENFDMNVPFIIGHPKNKQTNEEKQKPNIILWKK